MTQAPPGALGGRYELRQLLSQSSTAAVYLAHDRELDRTVAAKVLAPSLAANPAVAPRLREAVTAAATVRDPHVVTVFDWGDDAGTLYVIMEYVPGSDLASTLATSTRLSPGRSAEVGMGLADGLDAAHRAGTVHGSLSPADVLLTEEAGVKVMDFGTATAGLAGYEIAPDVAARYAAPEQLQGRPADARSDLYSLGIVLYEAITGAAPFTATDPVALTEQKLAGKPPAPSTKVAGVPPALDALVERLLETDPTRRYASAREVSNDLRRVSATMHVPLSEPATVAAIAPVSAAPTTVLPTAKTPTPEPTRKSRMPWLVAAIVVLGLVLGGLVWWAFRDTNASDANRV